MDKTCFELGTEEGSPQNQIKVTTSLSTYPRRSARLIAKRQSSFTQQNSHLLNKSSVDNKTNRTRTLSEREEATKSSDSTVKRRKKLTRSFDSNNCTESVEACTSVDTIDFCKESQSIGNRTRSSSQSTNTVIVEGNNNKVIELEEIKYTKKSFKQEKKTDLGQFVSDSNSESETKVNIRKRKCTSEGEPQNKKDPKTQTTKDISVSNHSKKEKGKRKKKPDSNSSPVHKSVIQYTMSSKDNDQPGPSTEGNTSSQEEQASGGSSGENSDPIDPFLALMNEESKRLQMMLESHRLPPHLLGSLGTRLPHFFQKHATSSNNTKGQQLLEGIQCAEDESVQLQSCIEMGQLLVMGNEDTLSGFPVKDAVPALIHLLSMEHNFDMMMNACRALTYMMEALPRSTVIVADAIPVLLEKLQVIQCIDVAEQALSALEILSRKHSKSILQAGGVNACLLYLDFFSLNTQRCALSVAANCYLSVTEDEFHLVSDSIPILSARLQHQDKKSVESCCLSFSRLVENLHNNPKTLQEIASHGLFSSIQSLLMISPSVFTSHMFVTVVRMLLTLCTSCPLLAVDLLKLNIGETLKYLLVGSEEITLETIEINSRSSGEFYEIVSLICELMPPLPKDGIFEIDKLMTITKRTYPTTIQWEWQDNKSTWQPYGRVESRIIEHAHMAGEEDATLDIDGRTYIVEFAILQQINEETGNTRPVRRTVLDPNISKTDSKDKEENKADEDPRAIAICAEPSLCDSCLQSLVAVLYEVFTNMAAPSVKYKCLKALLRMINCSTSDVLVDILRNVSVSSYIATMLKSQDYRVLVGAIQMAIILMDKLPDVFVVYFHREGVIHAMEDLKSLQLKSMTTPKKLGQSTGLSTTPTAATNIVSPPSMPMSMPRPSSSAPETTTTSTASASDSPSTARRFVDMFRKSRRHLRKSLSRTRSDDIPPVYVPTHPVPLLPPPSLATPPSLPTVLTQGRKVPSEKSTPLDEGSLTKEKIREWIVQQVTVFLDKWTTSVDTKKNPALEVMQTLQDISERLDPSHSSCLNAISELFKLLSDPEINTSAFEFLYCNIPEKLTKVLCFDDNGKVVFSLNVRLRHFLHVFFGLPEQDDKLALWTPDDRPGLIMLLQKLHGSISQTEQLPVKVHDLPGKRGSHAMKFFNTHQIKCNLECHPSASGVQPWKGGTVRVDPLATLQAVEKYLLVKGVTKAEPLPPSDDMDGSDDSDSEEPMLSSYQTGSLKQQLEFLINDTVIPHNMTVFQAVKQFALVSLNSDSEEDVSALGHPDIWIKSHKIYYRLVGQGQSSKPKRSYSLPASPFDSQIVQPKRLVSYTAGNPGTKSRRKTSASSFAIKEGVRMTRSMSREQQYQQQKEIENIDTNLDILCDEHIPSVKLSPLLQAIETSKATPIRIKDPSSPIINLLRVLWALNNHWNDLYNGFPGNPIVSSSEFVSGKLTAKATRQLQDPLNVMTGNFPEWMKDLSKQCPFLFPFECRQTLFFLSTFDRDRGIARLQEQQPELSSVDSSERVTPKLEKKKRCVSRDGLLEQAEKIMEELSSSKAILEIQYADEVGIGLGPTLEFYTLVSRELQKIDLHMWRGDPCPLPGATTSSHVTDTTNTAGINQYVYSSVGLFPAPLGTTTDFSVVKDICNKFCFLGRFMAKAIMDFRMLDLPLSEAFYRWLLGQEDSFTAQDLQYVDPDLSRSFAQLADIAVKKRQLENDPLLTGTALQIGIESLTLDGGGTIEDLELDYTLPGHPDIELKPNGKDIPVTIHNLDEYLKLLLDWTLVTGVRRQMEAFRDGFNSVFPISSLQSFYSYEMDTFLCGANNQKWDIKELMEYCRPDHGYNHNSQAIQFLFKVLSSYSTTEQRQFIQFVTGSPRLPVGGFKALNPPLTIVRKTIEHSQSPDNFLPSVMTCVNYLKLPDYSSEDIMRLKLNVALKEGKQSFHLS